MIRLIAAMAFAMLLAACGQDNTPTPSAETAAATEPAEPAEPAVTEAEGKEKHSGIYPEYMNSEIRPGDDFNAFVSGTWIDSAEIPADRASNSVGLEVHEQAVENVRVIIEESAEGDFAKGTDEQKVGDLYASYMDMDTRNALGVTPLQNEFAKVQALASRQDLAVYFAEANKLGINVPF